MKGKSRRRFVQTASAVSIGYWVSGTAARGESNSPNERLRFAGIGVGGKGGSDIDQASKFGDIVALCDIDDKRLDAKGKQFPKAAKFRDFRNLLESMGPKLDAVVVSTPDHTHAPAAVMAMRMGKHVYCQKPLTHSVHEARVMRQVARDNQVCTQMGNQGTADPGLRQAVEIIRSGAIGPVREAIVWTNRPFHYWKQAPDIVARPKEVPPIPAHVHWELFLGPAPYRPYHPAYHPHNWRGFWDFGTGALGDMGCHTANMPFMALQLGLPHRVSAEHSELNPETYPAWSTITYEFPSRGTLPPVKLTWYEGAKEGKRHLPPAALFQGEAASDSGSMLIGAKGTLFSPNDYGARFVLLPKKEFVDFRPPAPTLARIEPAGDTDTNQKREWVAAIRAGRPALAFSNFDYASVLTEAMLLGNVAVRAGVPIDYDGKNGRVTNNALADRLLATEYRDGWTL